MTDQENITFNDLSSVIKNSSVDLQLEKRASIQAPPYPDTVSSDHPMPVVTNKNKTIHSVYRGANLFQLLVISLCFTLTGFVNDEVKTDMATVPFYLAYDDNCPVLRISDIPSRVHGMAILQVG